MTQEMRRKLGLVVECGPAGADLKVFRHVIRQLDSNTDIEPSTMDNKKKLVAGCGETTKLLLNEGCDRVLIAWDLFPAWREDGQKPCRKEDRENIFAALEAAGIAKRDFESPAAGKRDARRVFLVCIQEELEAWLLADHQAVATVLSRPSHKAKVPATKKPEETENPKKRLVKIFKQEGGIEYNDRVHAERVIQAVTDFRRIARACPTFSRFVLHAAQKVLL
jgi:Domain of unknown function (DUF4276)